MTVKVTVDATWRMSRVEFSTPHDLPGLINGYGETVLTEPGSPDAKLYGVLLAAEPITRPLAEVMEDTVEVDGVLISVEEIVEALKLFMTKWRAEDVEKPAPTMALRAEPAVETPMPDMKTVQVPEWLNPKS